jgi:RNA polymerase sigma-70 factor (ECF subfamily)
LVCPLVSEIFVQVIKGLPKFRNQHTPSFTAWIFTIARNTITDFYRCKGRTPQQVALDDLADESPTGFDPYTLLVERENRSELRTLLQQLPDRRREVLTLRYFAGLRNLEIADVIGIDERTVASHLSRGLKDLYEAYVKKLKTRESDSNAT